MLYVLQKFDCVCKYLLASMNTDVTKVEFPLTEVQLLILNCAEFKLNSVLFVLVLQNMYVAVALLKEHVLSWIQQIKTILWQCCR